MRSLSSQEKIEFFILAPLFFCLTVALFVFSVWNEPIDIGYLIACLLLGIGAATKLSKAKASFLVLLLSIAGMQLTPIAFFNTRERQENDITFALQYLAIYLMCLSSITTITWLIKGKPALGTNKTTI